MPKPKGMKMREWLEHGYPDDAYFSYEWGGDNDDELFWSFKRTDLKMLENAFLLLMNGGAMSGFRLEEKKQPFIINTIASGWRVWPKGLDFEFMDMDSIHSLLIHYFKERGVTLTLINYDKLLNLKPRY